MEEDKIYIGSSNASPVPEFLNDQLIEDSIGLSRNCDNDLLFQQLPLPEQLLQSDEKDGEDDSSNSLNNRNDFDLTGPAAVNPEQQDQMKVIFWNFILYVNFGMNSWCWFSFAGRENEQ